jgi:hypothetical protein
MNSKQCVLEGGSVLIPVIAFMTIGIIVVSGFVNWGVASVRLARQAQQKEQAIQIAEAGIDYYRWHLAHAPTDFQDGTGTVGPYVHDFFDKQGVKIGEFALTIDPPPVGSTVVTITATGTVVANPGVQRAVKTRIGKQSFAKYAVLSNSDISIGASIIGPMHSNGFLYMVSGSAANLMTSTKTTGTSSLSTVTRRWGVYDAGDPIPPASLTTTTATFNAGREIGVPALDFAGITVDLAQMKTAAQTSGKYYAASGSGLGYHIVLANNDTFNIYTVNTLATGGGGCEAREWWNTPSCPIIPNSSWSINTQTILGGGTNVPFPANGIIFVEDNVWVDGSITTARLTIAAANLSGIGTQKNIIVNSDLRYNATSGAEVIGLIAQDNFWIGVNSSMDLRVDAAILAQNGRVSRYGYRNCTNEDRSDLTLYGMFASNKRYAYGNLGSGCSTGFSSGYQDTRTYIYDPYLLYGPPPSFPLTSAQYQILSWDEI